MICFVTRSDDGIGPFSTESGLRLLQHSEICAEICSIVRVLKNYWCQGFINWHWYPELSILIKPLLLLLHKVEFHSRVPHVLQRYLHTENNFKYHGSSTPPLNGEKKSNRNQSFFSLLFSCLIDSNSFSIPALTVKAYMQ